MQTGGRLNQYPLFVHEAAVGKCLADRDERLAVANYPVASAEHDLSRKYPESPAVLLTGWQKGCAGYVPPRFYAVLFQNNPNGNVCTGQIILDAGFQAA